MDTHHYVTLYVFGRIPFVTEQDPGETFLLIARFPYISILDSPCGSQKIQIQPLLSLSLKTDWNPGQLK